MSGSQIRQLIVNVDGLVPQMFVVVKFAEREKCRNIVRIVRKFFRSVANNLRAVFGTRAASAATLFCSARFFSANNQQKRNDSKTDNNCNNYRHNFTIIGIFDIIVK